jgi:hypothetical protein
LAVVQTNCVDVYPIRVSIQAEIRGQKLSVFSCKQQDLFRKYSSRRQKAIQDIKALLEDLKEDFDLE